MSKKSLIFLVASSIWMGLGLSSLDTIQIPLGGLYTDTTQEFMTTSAIETIIALLIIFTPSALAIYYHIKTGKNKQKQKEKSTAI